MSSDYDDDSDNVYNNNDEHFQTVYQSYSSAFLIERNQKNVENGGKIILPEAALAQLVEQIYFCFFHRILVM
ncbi:unnamed protein product [Rotaria sp. Silwood1]|nr:unnamed protein product [Rotaria sp. Silwood1]